MSRTINPKDENITIQDWWNYHHENKGNYRNWLSGSTSNEVWRNLSITKLIKKDKVVLNIGVGLGHCTKELAKKKCIVHALDISAIALDKIKTIATKIYLPSSLPDIPKETFDIAISHLVAQHMTNEDLLRQISGILKALKPCGVFAMQFAYADDIQKNDIPSPSTEIIKTGGVCRSLKGMAHLVEEAGGTISWVSRIGIFPEYGSGWYAIHIVRTDCPFLNFIGLEQPAYFERIMIKVNILYKRLLSILGHAPFN